MLRPAGVFVGYTIHMNSSLSAEKLVRASDLGPTFVDGFEDPENLAKTAGFVDTTVKDVTPQFKQTCVGWIEAMQFFGQDLKAELNREDYEEEMKNKTDMLLGIEEGLLRRALVVCRKD